MDNNQSLNQSQMQSYIELSFNNVPKNKTQTFKIHRQVSLIKQIYQYIEKIQNLIKTYNITIPDMEQAIIYAIETLFNLKSSQLVEYVKVLMLLVSQVAEGYPQILHNSSFQVRKEPVEKIGLNFGLQISRVSQIKSDTNAEENFNESLQQPLKIIKTDKNQCNVSNAKYIEAPNIKLELSNNKTESMFSTQASRKEEKVMPFNCSEISAQSQQSGIRKNLQKFRQQMEICYPIVWQENPFFSIHNKCITKAINDEYKKLCSQLPLKQGTHAIKFKLTQMGTVAFGIVLEQFKDNAFIDDRRCPAVKYLSFSNGKGMIKYQGKELMKSSSDLHLSIGSVLQIVYNSKKNCISFQNNQMKRPFELNLKENFKNKRIYFFIEMKHYQTQIQQL